VPGGRGIGVRESRGGGELQGGKRNAATASGGVAVKSG